MSTQALPMYLLIMQVQSQSDSALRGVSVWAEAADAVQAQTLASARLAEAGWSIVSIDNVAETSADDYFRPCPSQQAFERAQTEVVAWRFVDE